MTSDGTEDALGTSANDSASVPQIAMTAGTETVGASTGKYLRRTFQRSLTNDQGSVVPELSADLVSWNADTDGFVRMGQVLNGNGTATEVWRSRNPITTPGAFARLRVTLP